MKLLKNIMVVVALFGLWSCSDDIVPAPGAGDNDGETFTITASVAMPDIMPAGSRAMGDSPDYAGLKLYLAEFDMNGNEPLNNFFSNLYRAENERAGNNLVTFNVTLKKSVEPKVLHLIAVPSSVDLDFTYGSEGTLIPGLTTSGGNEAYWRRLEFPSGYGIMVGDVWTTSQATINALTNVPLIRNFGKITMVNGATANFTLEGFAVVNTPTSGSVAPWDYTAMRFPDYLDDSGSQLDYADLSYGGMLPGNANITDNEPGGLTYSTAPKYIYERPFSSVNRTLVIVKGRYNGGESSYYKIDLGYQDTDGVFKYYNLLRNFNYTVTIKSVGASGYATAKEAMDGVVYNNLSFDVTTNKMLNISNGTDMVWVNFTTAVVTQNTDADRTIKFGFKYAKNIGTAGETVDNSSVTDPTTMGLVPGDVIESVTETTAPTVNDKGEPTDYTGWKFYEIKTHAPTDETKQQSFTIINKDTGLGRTIDLVLRTPWELDPAHVRVFAGNYNLPGQFPYDDTTLENKVVDGSGAKLTIFFTIPEDLPEAIFPLSFELESDRQNIENNPIGTLLVTSGPSVFDGVIGTRIKYIKPITWTDYNTVLDASHPTAVKVPADPKNPDNGKYLHRVRCRLQTITSLEALGIGTNGTTTTKVRITNPYFKLRGGDGKIEVTFTRTRGQSLSNAPNN